VNISKSRRLSLFEAKANAIIGIIVSWLVTFYVLPIFDVHMNVQQATWTTLTFFILSTARAYGVSRCFSIIRGDTK
jgi:hypothetical protein